MIEWLRIEETNLNAHDTLPNIHNSNHNLKVTGKTHITLKGIISNNGVDVTDLKHVYYISEKCQRCYEKKGLESAKFPYSADLARAYPTINSLI